MKTLFSIVIKSKSLVHIFQLHSIQIFWNNMTYCSSKIMNNSSFSDFRFQHELRFVVLQNESRCKLKWLTGSSRFAWTCLKLSLSTVVGKFSDWQLSKYVFYYNFFFIVGTRITLFSSKKPLASRQHSSRLLLLNFQF